MYANPGTKWACPITIPCRNQLTIKNLTLTVTTLRHSEIKTKGEKLHKFITVTQESNSNQRQENTNESNKSGNSNKAIGRIKVYGHPTKKTKKEYILFMPSKLIDRSKERIEVLCRPN